MFKHVVIFYIFHVLVPNKLWAHEEGISRLRLLHQNDTINIIKLISEIENSHRTTNFNEPKKNTASNVIKLKVLSQKLLQNNGASFRKYGELGQVYTGYFQLVDLFEQGSITPDFLNQLSKLRASAEKNGSDRLCGSLNRLEASYYSNFKKDFRQSILHNNSAIKYFLRAADTVNLADAYNAIALNYTELDMHDKSIEFFYKSQKLQKDPFQKYTTYINLADLYRLMHQYDNAISSLKKAKSILNADNPGELYEINLYLKMATVLIEKKDFKAALENINQAQIITNNDKNNIFKGRIYYTRGMLHYRKGEYEHAISELEKSLDFQKRNNFSQRDIMLNNALGWAYFRLDSLKRNNPNYRGKELLEESKKYFLNSYRILDITQVKKNKWDTYRALKKIYTVQGNYKQAFEMAELEYAMADSINDLKIKTAFIKQEVTHEYNVKREADSLRIISEKLQVKAEMEQEKAENRLLYLSIVVLVLGVLIFMLRIKYKQQKKQMELERQFNLVEYKQKEMIKAELDFLKAQINPHFLFNVINSIYFKINKQDNAAKDALLGFSNLLRYQLYECNQPKVPIEKEVKYIKEYINLQSLRKQENISVHLDIAENISGFEIPPLLLIPFIENAFKHLSCHRNMPNTIDIILQRNENLFTFKVSNSFLPSDENTLKDASGIGTRNVERRLDLLYPDAYTLEHGKKGTYYNVILTLKIQTDGF